MDEEGEQSDEPDAEQRREQFSDGRSRGRARLSAGLDERASQALPADAGRGSGRAGG